MVNSSKYYNNTPSSNTTTTTTTTSTTNTTTATTSSYYFYFNYIHTSRVAQDAPRICWSGTDNAGRSWTCWRTATVTAGRYTCSGAGFCVRWGALGGRGRWSAPGSAVVEGTGWSCRSPRRMLQRRHTPGQKKIVFGIQNGLVIKFWLISSFFLSRFF